jgi:hypothetical protein
MKKLLLIALMCIAFIACTNNRMTSDAFINDLNSFDSTATYVSTVVDIDNNACTFIIKQNDSIFSYVVERDNVSKAIMEMARPGNKVK